MQARVEGLPVGVDMFEAKALEGGAELVADDLEALNENLIGPVLGCCRDGEVQVIQGGEEVCDQFFVGALDNFLAFALDAFAIVVEIRLKSKEAVIESRAANRFLWSGLCRASRFGSRGGGLRFGGRFGSGGGCRLRGNHGIRLHAFVLLVFVLSLHWFNPARGFGSIKFRR